MKIMKSLEESGLLIKGVSKTIKNKTKEHRDGFLGMFLGILGASFFGNLLRGKRVKWSKIPGWGVVKQVEARLEQVRIFNALIF